MSAEFGITTRIEGDVAIVVPRGDLDAVTSPALARVLQEHLGAAEPCRGVVLDFSGVEFCDSRCIGVLVASYRHARDRGIGMAVARPRGAVQRLFVIAGIDQVITVEEDLGRAVKAVTAN
ncbi:STAS domain-containing protein [Thermobifida cellulosilytica]|uniref:STAS domain-containing protein n=1 Tax=Thermobifida cellulosilytica TaxID=144786 RepID=UPI001E32DEC0|nr:STAS domain-containing protein [Thermobifida cellulosilytica]